MRLLRTRVHDIEVYIKEVVEDANKGFDVISDDFKKVSSRIDEWGRLHGLLAGDVRELKEELATNGVVSRLAALRREFNELRKHTSTLITEHDRQLSELSRNGVATAINKLNTEVFGKKKDVKDGGVYAVSLLRTALGEEYKQPQEATLAGKVDAIIEHLGLDLTVKPAEQVPAKVVAKRKVTKKKGRR